MNGSRFQGLRAGLRRAGAFHDAVVMSRWRAGLEREARSQRDTLAVLVCLQGLGIDDPAGFDTAELAPEMIAAYHDWHVRQGRTDDLDCSLCC